MNLPITAHAGLSPSQAKERLERDGPNELPKAARRTVARIALEVVREPMLAMLLAAGGIYLAIGDRVEALVLLLFAGMSIVITIVQEARTENVLETLRDLAAPRALVIRDGATVRIPGREVVEGDILVLDQGDRVPADAALLEAQELEVDESLLTGESLPVRKRPAEHGEALSAGPGGDDGPQVFSGSVITRGNGTARVFATGHRSQIGQIGRSLESLESEAPRLQRETSRVVALCAAGGVAIALAIVVLYGLSRGQWLEALLAGIATAMSLLPEEFPVVLAVFLAMGAWRIAQVGVLTRRAAAIETLGSATVLCTDKTGTLTQNRMSVVELWSPEAGHSTLDADTVNLTYLTLLETSVLASAPVPVDPMEVAFHAAARAAGIAARKTDGLVQTHGLRPDLLAMSNVWRPFDETSPFDVAAKGAPEAIARICRLEGEGLRKVEEATQEMARRGIRVLGVAAAKSGPDYAGKAIDDHKFQFIGLVGLADPLRSGVPEAIEQCRAAGIRIVMITGDYPVTAKAIATAAGITASGVMTGDEVAALPEAELASRAEQTTVFARTMPDQKLRIVSALKDAGEVVAMTGDGVNDAPALKASHIGIAMGRRGTDVAREAADIVLVEDDFGAIISAVRVGRRIYDNIRKALGFIFAVHVPIAGLAILPLIFGSPIVLGPLQIALLEMIIDPVCALVFEAERPEQDIMKRPPRRPDEKLFSLALIARGVAQGSLAFAALAVLYLGALSYGLEHDALRTITFVALVAATMALVLANRSFSTSLMHAFMRHNITFRYVAAFVAAGTALILAVPFVRDILNFVPLGPMELLTAAATGLVVLIGCELVKGSASMLARIRGLVRKPGTLPGR
jgi:P-type Ca2+ transporter type 2C